MTSTTGDLTLNLFDCQHKGFPVRHLKDNSLLFCQCQTRRWKLHGQLWSHLVSVIWLCWDTTE